MRSFIRGILTIVLAAIGVAAQTGPQQQQQERDLPGSTVGPTRTSDEPVQVRSLGIVLTPSPEGIVISEVFVSMPAYAAGLCVGDLLMAVNRQPVTSVEQAVELTRNIPEPYVMVELQRRDMHISRRVDVADGLAGSIGLARDGTTVAVTFRRLGTAAISEIKALATALAAEVPDTMILDLRNDPDGSAHAAQEVVRALESIIEASRSQHDQIQLVLLRPDDLNASANVLADALTNNGQTIVLSVTNAPMLRRDARNSVVGATMVSHPNRPALVSALRDQAPVYWNMAEFRSRYPAPDRHALQHPMLAYAPGIAPLAWGINGTAWEALNIARSML